MSSNQMKMHAVVIGGSIAGLLTARKLHDHFERVTVIERDALPQGAENRKGVPQGRQPHVLLQRGLLIMDQTFPGFSAELQLAGGVPMNMGVDARWHSLGNWRPRYQSSIDTVAASRPLIEATLRRRLSHFEAIRFVTEAEAIGLVTDPTGTRVAGVRIRRRDHSQSEETILADFVVDTSGRDSHASEWLGALGFPTPEVTTINAFAGYATRIYRRLRDVDWKMMYVQPAAPDQTRGAIIIPMEGDRWHVTMIGMNADYPPTDEADFLEFARSLPVPEIYETLSRAEPLSPVIGYRRVENRLYSYDQLPRYLENFALLGDAVYALNPVYGQGMSIASMSAEELERTLAEHRQTKGEDLTGLVAVFQKRLGNLLAGPWQVATGEDFRWSKVEGVKPNPDPAALLMQNYIGNVMLAANHNPVVLDVVYQVLNMMASPEIFFRPDIVLHVMAAVNPLGVPQA
jgi:2-polyprenyl-6-methoxyphenol hydroxylase-like FAD-dependent oxidoreductase